MKNGCLLKQGAAVLLMEESNVLENNHPGDKEKPPINDD
jgi:hypothetical protein